MHLHNSAAFLEAETVAAVAPDIWARDFPAACAALGISVPDVDPDRLRYPDPRVAAFCLQALDGVIHAEPGGLVIRAANPATARPLVAVAGGVGLAILSRVLNADYLPGVAVLSPYLPSNDVDLWLHLFQQPARTDGMAAFLALQAAYTVVFLGLTWWWFTRRDVLS